MRIEDLRYLLTIAESDSISDAARQLYISQQGLSQQIRKLERTLNTDLIIRDGKAVHFTEKGEQVLALCRKVIAGYDEMLNLCSTVNEKNVVSETQVLFATPFLCFTVLTDFLQRTQQRNPLADLRVIEACPSVILRAVTNQRNAIGLYNTPDFKYDQQLFKESGLVFEKLIDCEHTLLVNKTSPFAERESVSIDEIARSRFALIDFEQENEIAAQIFSSIPDPKVVLKTTNRTLYLNAITNGSAIGFSNTFLNCYQRMTNLTTIPFDPPIKIYIGIVQNLRRTNSIQSIRFLGLLKDTIVKLGGKQTSDPHVSRVSYS